MKRFTFDALDDFESFFSGTNNDVTDAIVAGIKEAIEKCGARLLFLPPYSPDFSPIECMWSKLKNSLRRRDTRTLGSYHDSLNDSLSELEDDDFIGWYEHCGYRVNL